MADDGYEYELEVTLTRGEGASDRDRQKITVGANTLDELDEKVRDLRERMEEWALEFREIQPPDRPRRALADDQAELGEGSA